MTDGHPSWCSDDHDVPVEAVPDIGEPCRGPLDATAGPVAAYLRDSGEGPMVAFMPLPVGALLTLSQAGAFGEALLRMVARAHGA